MMKTTGVEVGNGRTGSRRVGRGLAEAEPCLLVRHPEAIERLRELALRLEERFAEISEAWEARLAEFLAAVPGGKARFAVREELAAIVGALRRRDDVALTEVLEGEGERLRREGASIDEIVVSSHLLVDAGARLLGAARLPLLDRLAHVRTAIMSRAYVSAASGGTRVGPPVGREADLMATLAAAGPGGIAVERLAMDRIPTLRETEHALIQRALRVTGGNKLRAARQLGVSRKWLYARLRDEIAR